MPERPVTPDQKYAAAQLDQLGALASLVTETNQLLRDLVGALPEPPPGAVPGGSEASSGEVPLREPDPPATTKPPAKKTGGSKTTTTREPATPGRRRSRPAEG